MKTVALLPLGCLAGAMLGEAAPAQREALDRYGSVLAKHFRLPTTCSMSKGDAATVAKRTGKDAGPAKGYVRHGVLRLDAQAWLN